ncbi:uncharacterized protein LOC144764092 [Lissotriton helveticus]
MPIYNLSSSDLNKEELSVLSRGLSFVPCAPLNKFKLHEDLFAFFRKVRLKKYFEGRTREEENLNRSGCKPPSSFTPTLDTVGPEVQIFERMVLKDITRLLTGVNKPNFNLTKQENLALNNIEKNNALIIKPCDKGGGITVFDKNKYDTKIREMLSVEEHYRPAHPRELQRLTTTIRELTNNAFEEGFICEDELIFLNKTNPVTPALYGLPKTHKSEVNPPMRPIISTIGSCTEPLSKYIDKFLCPLTQKYESFVRDTGDMITKVEGTAFDARNNILVTLDIEALYTNIPQCQALQSVSSLLQRYPDSRPDRFILQCLEVVLLNNFFDYDGALYKQVKGTSMGASCAPSIANAYMGEWELQHVYNEVAPFFENVRLWRRFIDDIFFIWHGTEEQLQDYIGWLNSSDPNLKFTSNYHTEKVEFLDIEINGSSGILENVFIEFYADEETAATIGSAKRDLLQHAAHAENIHKDITSALSLCQLPH